MTTWRTGRSDEPESNWDIPAKECPDDHRRPRAEVARESIGDDAPDAAAAIALGRRLRVGRRGGPGEAGGFHRRGGSGAAMLRIAETLQARRARRPRPTPLTRTADPARLPVGERPRLFTGLRHQDRPAGRPGAAP